MATIMREIQASEAKTHLPQLLDDVERGETIVITRHGRAIARLVPEAHRRQEEIDRAIQSIRALRRHTGKITLAELLSARHEGHKYLMPFVIDASIAACWAFEDEDHPVAALALERIRSDEALVPSLWWFEVRNTLIVNERRGRLTEADVTVFLRGLARLGVTIDRTPDEAAILTLARRHRLTVYEASYLDLAQREGVLLATLDTDLVNAARGERLRLIGE